MSEIPARLTHNLPPVTLETQEAIVCSSTVDIATQDGTADAYLSQPDEGGPYPGVLALPDAFGLRPQIQNMADRIAAQGYVVLAPNVYYRGGRAPLIADMDLKEPGSRAAFMDRFRAFRDELTSARVIADGAAYLDFLGQVSEGPAAVDGYCMGGRLGWRIAAALPDRVQALAAFHPGRLVTDADDSPHRSSDEVRAELYLGYADHDPNMTGEQIYELERALDDAGVRYESEVYSGAEHGFTMADTLAYSEAAAEHHFAQLFALLARTARREAPERARDDGRSA
jgi:carboxymethylenebutenolidase